MVYSDVDIKAALSSGDITINPFNETNLKPGSYKCSLGKIIYRPREGGVVDARHPVVDYDEIEIFPETGYVLNPGEFILAQTAEAITLSNNLAASSDSVTTLARLGVQIVLSSTYIEPGQVESHETLEIANHGNRPVQLFPGMSVVKLIFHQLKTPAAVGYAESGSYAYQSKPYPRS